MNKKVFLLSIIIWISSVGHAWAMQYSCTTNIDDIRVVYQHDKAGYHIATAGGEIGLATAHFPGVFITKDRTTLFSLLGNKATLWFAHAERPATAYPCKEINDTLTEHKIKDITRPVKGLSTGGRVRSEPSIASKHLFSLRKGDSIKILSRHPATMNGYHWFAIQSHKGKGYQWGGLLCSKQQNIEGALPAQYCQ